jgi:hypothetical protein
MSSTSMTAQSNTHAGVAKPHFPVQHSWTSISRKIMPLTPVRTLSALSSTPLSDELGAADSALPSSHHATTIWSMSAGTTMKGRGSPNGSTLVSSKGCFNSPKLRRLGWPWLTGRNAPRARNYGSCGPRLPLAARRIPENPNLCRTCSNSSRVEQEHQMRWQRWHTGMLRSGMRATSATSLAGFTYGSPNQTEATRFTTQPSLPRSCTRLPLRRRMWFHRCPLCLAPYGHSRPLLVHDLLIRPCRRWLAWQRRRIPRHHSRSTSKRHRRRRQSYSLGLASLRLHWVHPFSSQTSAVSIVIGPSSFPNVPELC